MTKFCCFLAATSLLLTTARAAHARTKPPVTAYLGAIVTDAETGLVLLEDNADVLSPPASMAKLMTFAVLHDQLASGALKLDTLVTVTSVDSKIGGTQVWLKENEIFPVEELIYAMMIQSANDAAHALARTAAGSPAAFVELMNAKARELGMTRTTFRTPHGLPPRSRRTDEGDLSTPRDCSLLCRYLLRETDVTKYTSIRSRPFGTGRPTGPVMMNNHNHLLGKVAGLDGLKTGYTSGASFCLSATAERSGRRVIVVTMGSPDSKTRDFKVAELVERGFAALPAPTVVKTGGTAINNHGSSSDKAAPRVETVPTVTTDKSTPVEPVVTFRVIPPGK